jgi:hypothetical protein
LPQCIYIKHLELAVFHWWFFVQGFDMILVFLLDRRSLQLHRRRQQVIFDGPRLRLQVHVLNDFKALQLLSDGQSVQVLQNQLFDTRVVAHIFELSVVDTVLTSPRDQVLEVRHDYSDEVALQAVTVHVALQHVRALAVNCLQELSGDVFTLSELEDVLLTINNLQLAVLSPLTNITGVEPTVLVNRFFSHLRILVVANKDVVTTQANFTALRVAARSVTELRDIDQLALYSKPRN